MLDQVSEIVKEGVLFALDSLNKNKACTAGVSALGAWTEAAFLYLFLMENSMATDSLIPSIKKITDHFQAVTYASTFSVKLNPSQILLILKAFRTYLRKKHPFMFGLSEIQDQLCERKAKRLLDRNELFNLRWQMYGEALWLYFETANDKSIEQYIVDLPEYLQKGLSDIGFKQIDEDSVQVWHKLSDELLFLCCKSIK